MAVNLKDIELELQKLTRQFLRDSGNPRAADAVTLDASLDRDLGIGSLERTELFQRIEQKFTVRLPDKIMAEAENLRDLVLTIQEAKPSIIKPSHIRVTQLEASTVNVANCKTLVGVLLEFNEYNPNRPHAYVVQDDGSEKIITYGDIYKHAKILAQGMQSLGLKPGETVAIMLPTSEDFFYAFFGVLFAGAIPVPIYPPFRPNLIEEYAMREAKILQNAEVRLLITFSEAENLSKLLKVFITSLTGVVTLDMLRNAATKQKAKISWQSTDIALIQYTSGSTGDPKGVVLTHRNLLSNIRAYGQAIQIKPSDAIVSWLPLYHDMGLIGAWLGSLYHGIPLTLMSPLQFLTRPERWLWAIHTHRATLSAGPNFAYDLCIKKIASEDLEGLDLSSWRLAFNGAEMIYPNTLREFSKRYEHYNFKTNAFFPVYGLAENSLALTFPTPNEPLKIDRIKRFNFEIEQKAIAAQANKDFLEFISCGKPLPDHPVRIVDEYNQELPERHIGNIQFQGPSAMQGYYHNPVATQKVYHQGWWDTGDLGYFAEGELFITGRKKDVIIKSGRNLFPAEIEELVAEVHGIRQGCVAAIGVNNPKTGTEKFIIIAETRERNKSAQQSIAKDINRILNDAIGIPPDEIILTPPGRIPKTSSGKLRRSDCKRYYLENKLQKQRIPFWIQALKLSSIATAKKIKTWLQTLIFSIYSFYASTILVLLLLKSWALSHLLKRNAFAKYLKTASRITFYLIGAPLKIQGQENLFKHKTMIFVSNHASYMDTLILTAILPTNALFVGKKELLNVPILKTLIIKLNHIMVDRLDFNKSEEDLNKMRNAIQDHYSIAIFAEGTFTYATGLRSFKLGAFKLAVDTHTPICNIAIKGSRKMLRSGSALIKPSKLNLTISTPIMPQDNSWQEIIRLRDESKLFIAKYCGEPTLDLISAGYHDKKHPG